MSIAYLFEKVDELKGRFKKFFQQKKKIQALENYSSVVPFPNKLDSDCFQLLKRCFDVGFMDDESERFLNHMLTKVEGNYLDWTHKTKWLKGEMHQRWFENQPMIKPKTKTIEQFLLFDMDKSKLQTIPLPMEVIDSQRSIMERIRA